MLACVHETTGVDVTGQRVQRCWQLQCEIVEIAVC